RARDLRLDRLVAVKTLRSDLARDPTSQARFRREPHSAASPNHPSIIAVYDTGEDVIDGVPIPYIVMRYADARSLQVPLADNRRLLPEPPLDALPGCPPALAAVRAPAILLRQLNPADVKLLPHPGVQLMPFHIARAVDDAQPTRTHP